MTFNEINFRLSPGCCQPAARKPTEKTMIGFILQTTTEGIILFFTEVHLQHFFSQKNRANLSVEIICFDVGGDLGLPLVAVVQQLLLVVEQLLVSLRRKLEVGAFDDGVHGTSLLAEAAVDAPQS